MQNMKTSSIVKGEFYKASCDTVPPDIMTVMRIRSLQKKLQTVMNEPRESQAVTTVPRAITKNVPVLGLGSGEEELVVEV